MKKFSLCLMAVVMTISLMAGCNSQPSEPAAPVQPSAGAGDSSSTQPAADGIVTKADLEGKIIALQTDSSAEAALAGDEVSSKVKGVVKFPGNIAALNDLKAGRVDAVILDEVVANYYAAKDPSNFKVLNDSLAAEEYGIAFKKGNTEIYNKVVAALGAMQADGTTAKISTEWFGKDIFKGNFETPAEAIVPDTTGKKLVVGLDDSFPPMGFRDQNNEIVGFDIDLAKKVGAILGYEVVLQPIDWASKELELETGNTDCVWNALTITPERQESMLITAPYLANNQVIVVKP